MSPSIRGRRSASSPPNKSRLTAAGYPSADRGAAPPLTTNPATSQYPHNNPALTRYDQEGSFAASLPSGLTFLAGVWLVMAPFVLDYENAGGGFDGFWNDIVIGTVIALLALARALAPRSVPWFSMVNVALGFWLVAAPFVLGYLPVAPQAVTNDIVVGLIVIVMAATSAVITFGYRARAESGK